MVTIPDELDARFEACVRERGASPEAVVEDALREYLEGDGKPGFRPFGITPVEEKDDEGESDVSMNHDEYFAEFSRKNNLPRK